MQNPLAIGDRAVGVFPCESVGMTMPLDRVVPEGTVASGDTSCCPLPAIVWTTDIYSGEEPFFQGWVGAPAMVATDKSHRLTNDMTKLGVAAFGEGNFAATPALAQGDQLVYGH